MADVFSSQRGTKDCGSFKRMIEEPEIVVSSHGRSVDTSAGYVINLKFYHYNLIFSLS